MFPNPHNSPESLQKHFVVIEGTSTNPLKLNCVFQVFSNYIKLQLQASFRLIKLWVNKYRYTHYYWEGEKASMAALLRASNKIIKGVHACKKVWCCHVYYFGRCITFTMRRNFGIFGWLFMLCLSNRGSFKMMKIPKETHPTMLPTLTFYLFWCSLNFFIFIFKEGKYYIYIPD